MPALRFQTCRLLSGNVRNKELTIAQRRILRKLRRKKGSIKKKIYPRINRNNYIQLQTTRKLSLFYGNLPITKMHRRIKRTSYIPFLLNPETRLDVILVRLHFCETLPQARQPISHRKVCVNNGIVNISHFQVSHGDIISFQENYARTLGEEIRRFFYIKILVEKIIGKFLPISPKFGSREERRISKTEYLSRVRMRRISKIEWLRRLKTKKKCLLLLTLQKLHFSMQKADVERGYEITRTNVRVKQFLYSTKYKRMMGDLHRSVILLLREEKKRRMIPLLREGKNFIPTVNLFLREWKKIRIKDLLRSANLFLREGRKIRIKRIEQLPTHYSEVNYRTLKAVVFYGPNIDHIPHNIRLKDPNLLQAQ